EYIGREDVDGTSAYKIKVVRKNGDVNFVYLDPDHFLEIRILSQRVRHGAQEETETDVGDYEKIGGVFIPFSIEAGRKGDPDKQNVQSIGAIAIDPTNAKNVWVGGGESWTRNSVSIGDGIYKSTDGGETWNHVGLEKSERIARIAVDPKSSDIVFAAVPGALWS